MNKEDIKKILHFCSEYHVSYLLDHALHKYTSFKVGGNAEIFIEPANPESALLLQKLLTDLRIHFFYLGGGSNLLISDKGYKGVVIKLNYPDHIDFLSKDHDRLVFKVAANSRSANVARRISTMGYSGLEFLTTIPGTLGGAIVQNAGCYGREISDIVLKIGISENGKFFEIDKTAADFSYRSSIFKRNERLLIHYAIMEAQSGKESEIESKITEYKEHRLRSQPRNRKNAGSVFKNPPEGKAWTFIKECGLSGYGIGGAQVSTDHANFILNVNNATATDIHLLILHIQNDVAKKCGIHLQPEIVFVGEF